MLAVLAALTAAASKPHIMMIIADDFGWADIGYHALNPDGGVAPDPTLTHIATMATPNMDKLSKAGLELNNHYAFKFCSPSRCSLQSGRNPIHVNVMNLDPTNYNPSDPVSGFAAVPRNMTTIAAVMKRGGYETHFSGKWDVGMATPTHTPRGRGYDASLHYFHHANDYWTYETGSCPSPTNKSKHVGVVDLWEGKMGGGEGPAHSMVVANQSTCTQENHTGCVYEDLLFSQHVLDTIDAHNPSTPLFYCWAPHIVHAPLQVPDDYLDKFDFMKGKATGNQQWWRQLYMSMVNYLDAAIGDAVQHLQTKEMWANTLMVFSADNGGPIYWSGVGGANNWPLRGGKGSNFQGGIRVNAWVSGGYLPAGARGRKLDGLVALWDWYGTFAALAGVDPTDHAAAAANLPAVDSIDMWPWLSGTVADSPRKELAIGGCSNPRDSFCSNIASTTTVEGVIQDHGGGKMYKLLVGEVWQDGWTGPDYPNNTKVVDYNKFYAKCEGGCLFEIGSDPTEHVNLTDSNPGMVEKLAARIAAHQKTVFSPNRGSVNESLVCGAAFNRGGFWGPFVK